MNLLPQPPSASPTSDDPQTKSWMGRKLIEYVEARGISMPFYRRGSKILEEAEELVEALGEFLEKPNSLKRRRHLMEEVADVAFTAAVAARQGSFSVEEAIEWKIAKDRGRNGAKPH